jgi:microcystin-dependent protein
MSCTNCFNGCEVVSDRCVKYSGIDIPELGIQTGDSLSHVEQSITTYLVSVLNGSGVKIDLTGINVCNTVQKYLPVCSNCTDVSIADIAKALIRAACDLQGQVDALGVSVTNIEAPYATGCLTVSSGPSVTHQVLQATINTLCVLIDDFDQLVIDLPTTYVSFDNIDALIQTYINDNGGANVIANRMVPFAVVPYFGPISGVFDSAGAGLNLIPSGGQDWRNIYLCNGNVAPDLRGYGLVGAINSVPGGALSPTVDPAIPGSGNPNYSLYDTAGANQVTLGSTQIPSHTHANIVNTVLTDPGHAHSLPNVVKTGGPYGLNYASDFKFDGVSQTGNSGQGGTGITAVTTITNAAAPIGGGLPHANIQPVRACYYIQYRPL